MIALPGMRLERAELLAENIRADVEALSGDRVAEVRRRVTVSIGVGHRTSGSHKPLDELLAQADAAVYEAKKSGRNRVCQYGDGASRVA